MESALLLFSDASGKGQGERIAGAGMLCHDLKKIRFSWNDRERLQEATATGRFQNLSKAGCPVDPLGHRGIRIAFAVHAQECSWSLRVDKSTSSGTQLPGSFALAS